MYKCINITVTVDIATVSQNRHRANNCTLRGQKDKNVNLLNFVELKIY